MGNITFDIESNNLLNEETIDYTTSPYVLKDTFEMHCIVVEEHDTGELIAFYDGDTYDLDGEPWYEEDGEFDYALEDYEAIEYTHKQMGEFKEYIENHPLDRVVAHNGINFDWLVCKLYFGMDYTVEPDSWCGRTMTIEDTMVLSKALNPDRFGGHSLDKLSRSAEGVQKLEFRKHIPKNKRFRTFAADMLYYCIFDVKSNTAVFQYLEKERLKDDWKWGEAIALEKAIAEIITRQEHRGFKFDKELAESSVYELDELMEERRVRVEPLLPPRPATKKFMKDYTPPVNQVNVKKITPPKNQFKGDRTPSKSLLNFLEKWDGELMTEDRANIRGKVYDLPIPEDVVVFEERSIASHMQKFIEKHGAKVNEDCTKIKIFDKTHDLPMPLEPLKIEMDATIDDTTHIKNWLVGLGWNPQEYKDKDITVKSGPLKLKRTPEELETAVDRYVEETLASNFSEDRLSHLEATPKTLKRRLLSRASKRSCKVLTNPSLTVGADKEMCPDLTRIAKKFPYAKDVVEYLTYKHRRSSILGGGLDWEDGEEEAEKGYIANLREDGRIPTPADSCGAATSRFKHRVVANVPRPTSLYGGPLRALFGVDEGFLQIGYDFDSLEAREEAHYCWKWEKGDAKEYCKSLTLAKPNDVHTKMAAAISKIIGEKFGRAPAKNVKYGCTYGAQEAKVAKTIGKPLRIGKLVFDAFWETASPLKSLKDALSAYWNNVGGRKFILGIDGRKIPTRAEHAILNSLFQSAGVICAKKAMVLHDRMLKEEGLGVDFFVDDWQNKDFCQQLVAYHDESQLEVRREAVEFKVFDTKEEAQEFKDGEDKIWSDIGDARGGKKFVGYNRAGELAAIAVKRAGQHFNLNVELTAGYMIGRNWRDCH